MSEEEKPAEETRASEIVKPPKEKKPPVKLSGLPLAWMVALTGTSFAFGILAFLVGRGFYFLDAPETCIGKVDVASCARTVSIPVYLGIILGVLIPVLVGWFLARRGSVVASRVVTGSACVFAFVGMALGFVLGVSLAG